MILRLGGVAVRAWTTMQAVLRIVGKCVLRLARGATARKIAVLKHSVVAPTSRNNLNVIARSPKLNAPRE